MLKVYNTEKEAEKIRRTQLKSVRNNRIKQEIEQEKIVKLAKFIEENIDISITKIIITKL